MSERTFIDTNVLVYADDAADPWKRNRAQELIRTLISSRTGVLSLQVLQEYFAAATRKLRMAPAEARARVEVYTRFEIVKLDAEDLLRAIDIHRVHQLSIWDSLIVQAAQAGGCRTLFTEDLQHGFEIATVTVVNPFIR